MHDSHMQYFLWDVALVSDVHTVGGVVTNIIGVHLVWEISDNLHTKATEVLCR